MSFERCGPAAWAIHPGEILRKEFLLPLGISGYRLAKEIGVPAQAISDITLEKRGVSAEVAIRLAKFFGTTEQFWMNLQNSYELAIARRKLKRTVARIKRHTDSAA